MKWRPSLFVAGVDIHQVIFILQKFPYFLYVTAFYGIKEIFFRALLVIQVSYKGHGKKNGEHDKEKQREGHSFHGKENAD
jgi:hypothetical protein